MRLRHPIRPLAALCGGLRIGTAMVRRRSGNPQPAHRAGARFGGLPVPI